MKKVKLVLPAILSIISLSSCVNQSNHVHNYGPIYPEIEPTCVEPGRKSFYYCEECGKYFDLDKNEITDLSIAPSGHKFVLSSDGYSYKCRTCNQVFSSGKTKIDSMKKTNIYLGSSIVNGYDSQSGDHYSFADMMESDYLKAELQLNNEEKTLFFRKTKSYQENLDGFAGDYISGDLRIYLDGNGLGKYNDSNFSYKVENGKVVTLMPVKELKSFSASYFTGDKSYKIAQDGYTLSDVQPRYYQGVKVGDRHSYIGLFETALEEHKNEQIDNFVIQLSTNDAGQFIDVECTTHIPFGEIMDNNVKDSSSFDKTTSLGALEYMIAKAKEVWGCDVTIFVCHMDTGTYANWVSKGYDLSQIHTNYADLYEKSKAVEQKWGCNYIDFWASREINDLLNSNQGKYFSDTLHLKTAGYEVSYYPTFRDLLSSGEISFKEVTYTLKVDGEIYKTINFDTNTKSIILPEIPYKKGYKIIGWDLNKIVFEDKTINAIYEKE